VPLLDAFECMHCGRPPVALVAVSELDAGRAAGPPIAEALLCGEHPPGLEGVLRFEGPRAGDGTPASGGVGNSARPRPKPPEAAEVRGVAEW
jgi:hypothetical protein